jgi:three-Cys-motif partner protein
VAPPEKTRWPIEPHTQVKHLILRRYLQAWLPIMARYNGRILFVDGFAGPGRYARGENGSPLIALTTLLGHPQFQDVQDQREVVFIFIEKEQDRARALEDELRDFETKTGIPAWVKYQVRQGEFAPEMTSVLDSVVKTGRNLAPAFAFIDPFGFAGAPMAIVRRIMANPRCECLITFMYESVNRFVGHPEAAIQAHFDELFGTESWRPLILEVDPERRRTGLVGLYRDQLMREAGAKFVRTFEMINRGNRTEYFLYFATNSAQGLSKMKEAMWRADPLGGEAFSDLTDTRQMTLLEPAADLLALQRLLQERFHGRAWVDIEDVERFVLEETPYSETIHLRRRSLGEMEKAKPSAVEARRPAGKRDRPGEYPAGTKLRFV